MTLDPKNVAARLGAKHVGPVPDVGGGAFGMARLAAILEARLGPRNAPPGYQPPDVRWVLRPRVPMSRETENWLILLADQLSTPERRVSPMELAAELLEELVQQRLGPNAPPPQENG